jgi:hypothetical protein
MRALVVLLAVLCFAIPVAGHELAIYTIVVTSEGPQPADVPKESLKEGDAVWIWMKDSTEGATLVVNLEKSGKTFSSPTLFYECELDAYGEKVDDQCDNRYQFEFNQYYASGTWEVTYEISINGTLDHTTDGTMYINEDEHNDGEHLHVIDYLRPFAPMLALFSLLAMMMVLSLPASNPNEEEPSSLQP